MDEVVIGQADDDKLTVTLKGDPKEIVKVLVHGLPYEAVVQLRDEMVRKLAARKPQ